MLQRIKHIIFAVVMIPVLVACGPVKMPPSNTYTLSNLQPAVNFKKSRTKLTLLISTPVASPGYTTSKMMYMMIPFKLRAFANHRWIAPPADMILPILAEDVRNRGYFKAVVTPPFAGVTNYRLDTQLLVLRQEFILPKSQVRLVMDVDVVNANTNRIVASKRFHVVYNAQDNNPYGGVIAANKAVNNVARQIARFVVRAVR
jgi:cholesterol transport system auxiliary component